MLTQLWLVVFHDPQILLSCLRAWPVSKARAPRAEQGGSGEFLLVPTPLNQFICAQQVPSLESQLLLSLATRKEMVLCATLSSAPRVAGGVQTTGPPPEPTQTYLLPQWESERVPPAGWPQELCVPPTIAHLCADTGVGASHRCSDAPPPPPRSPCTQHEPQPCGSHGPRA